MRGSSLTIGSVRGHLVKLTLPMVGAIAAAMAFNMIDTYFVAQLGARELAAISFTFPVVMILISLAIGLGAGTSSVIARAIGEDDWEKVRRLTTDSLVLSFILSSLLSIIGVFTIEPLFILLGATPDIVPLISEYMLYWYGGLAFIVVSMVGMTAIRATGDTKLPSMVMVIAVVVNVILDPIMIFGWFGFPRWELKGAAIATVIARFLTFAAAIYVLDKRKGMLNWHFPHMSEVWASFKSIMHVGLPAAGNNMIIPACNGVVVALVASFGVDAVAGLGVAVRVESVSLVLFYAMSAIIGPFVGQNLGAKKYGRIREAAMSSFLFSLAIGVFLALLLALAARPVCGLFADKTDVISVAVTYLLIVPISYGCYGVVMVVNAMLNAIGKPMPGVVISCLRVGIVYLPLAFIASRLWGLPGIFAAAAFSNIAVGLGAWWYILRECRKLEVDGESNQQPDAEMLPNPS